MKAQRLPAVVVITGTPGTGKTSVSKLLAHQTGARYISLTRIAYRHGLCATIDRGRHTHVLDMGRMRAFLRKLLQGEKVSVILDTHVADAVPKAYAARIIVLRCHPRVLEARLRRKGWRGSKIRENVLAELLDSCYATTVDYYGLRNVAQIETSKLTPRECVRSVRRIITKQPSQRVSVDWLSVLLRERSLGRYL